MPIQGLPPQAQLPPDLAGQLAQLQMRQQLSQALLGESMKPINPMRSSGRYIVPISPLEGLSQLGSTALNSKTLAETTGGMANVYAQANQRRNDAARGALSPRESLSGALTEGQSSSLPPGPWSPETMAKSQPQAGAAQTGTSGRRESLQEIYDEAFKLAPAMGTDVFTVLDNPLYKARIESALKDTQRTDLQKNMSDPSLKDWQDKENSMMVRDNSILTRGGKVILNNPTPSPGTYNAWTEGNPNPSANVPIPGATQNVEAMNKASAAGTASGKAPYTPEMVMVDGKIQPKFVSQLPGYPQTPNSFIPTSPTTTPQPVQPAPIQPPAAAQQPPASAPTQTPTPPQGAPQSGLQAPPYARSEPALTTRGVPQQADVQAKPIADPWQTMPKIETPKGYGMTPYQEGTAKNQAHSALELTNKYGEMAAQSNQRKAFNDQALGLVDQADTGFGAARYAEVRNALHRAFPSMNFDPSDTVALQKDLVNAATQKAKQQFGARITQSEVMLMLQKAAPNADMPKAAIKYLLNSDNAQLDYQTQQAADLGKYLKNGGDPQHFEAWYAKSFPLTNALSGVHLKASSAVNQQGGKQVQRTGTLNGKKVIQYSDGTTEYAN